MLASLPPSQPAKTEKPAAQPRRSRRWMTSWASPRSKPARRPSARARSQRQGAGAEALVGRRPRTSSSRRCADGPDCASGSRRPRTRAWRRSGSRRTSAEAGPGDQGRGAEPAAVPAPALPGPARQAQQQQPDQQQAQQRNPAGTEPAPDTIDPPAQRQGRADSRRRRPRRGVGRPAPSTSAMPWCRATPTSTAPSGRSGPRPTTSAWRRMPTSEPHAPLALLCAAPSSAALAQEPPKGPRQAPGGQVRAEQRRGQRDHPGAGHDDRQGPQVPGFAANH
jgi:hypothetical protein